jgi:methyl-accepting chemotaxis protein
MADERNRRRQIVVDKKFQYGVSFKISVGLACYLLIFCMMAMVSPFVVMLSGTASEEALVQASNEFHIFVKNLLLPLGFTFLCIALHSMLLSHRVAGPAFRFRKTLESVKDGDLSVDIKLRGGDYLTELADTYNETIVGIRQDVDVMKRKARAILDGARSASAAGSTDVRKIGEGLMEHAETLDKLLSMYRTSKEISGTEHEVVASAEQEEEAPATPVQEESI